MAIPGDNVNRVRTETLRNALNDAAAGIAGRPARHNQDAQLDRLNIRNVYVSRGGAVHVSNSGVRRWIAQHFGSGVTGETALRRAMANARIKPDVIERAMSNISLRQNSFASQEIRNKTATLGTTISHAAEDLKSHNKALDDDAEKLKLELGTLQGQLSRTFAEAGEIHRELEAIANEIKRVSIPIRSGSELAMPALSDKRLAQLEKRQQELQPRLWQYRVGDKSEESLKNQIAKVQKQLAEVEATRRYVITDAQDSAGPEAPRTDSVQGGDGFNPTGAILEAPRAVTDQATQDKNLQNLLLKA